MRSQRTWLLMTVAALGLLVQGCDKVAYSYLGNFRVAVPATVEIEGSAVQFAARTPVAAGTVQISGQLVPQFAAPLPSTLRFLIRQTQPSGAVVATLTFNLTVRPDGVIPNQLVPTPAMTLNAGDELRFVFQPLGTTLPPGRMKLKVLYEEG